MNPVVCNCHLAGFAEWLRKKDLFSDSPRCASPVRLKDVPVHEIPRHEFKCTGLLMQYILIHFYLYSKKSHIYFNILLFRRF